MASIKQWLPPAVRLQLRVAWRMGRDWRQGLPGRWASVDSDRPAADELAHRLTVRQGLGSAVGALRDNKVHNLGIAIHRVEAVVIQPGEVFSFWRTVGRPSARAGYLEGRTITGAAVGTTVGGGLCQLSGMVYLLALQAGLQILERHPHSRDLYTDSTRFAPLGADATVVYGYKDLRVVNTGPAPLRLRGEIGPDHVALSLCARAPLEDCELVFQREPLPDGTRVRTLRRRPPSTLPELLGVDDYPRLP
ncbi:MAG: vancomycin resistance protein [Burkholderiales bacterium]|nr:MAG: vancomycin resistance protein [Burkholderiales bacterium]